MAVTVGEASAMINAAIILLQITFPLAVVLIIVGLLKERESAATWSVVSRSIQNSFWPTILQSDHALAHNVRTRVVVLSWSATLGTFLLIIVGVATPLGLSDKLQLGTPHSVAWTYVQDPGALAAGTPDRAQYNYTRLCGYFNCPGVDGGYKAWFDDDFLSKYFQFDNATDIVDLRIPGNVSDVFTSGTAGKTIASLFDIQYRSYLFDSSAYTEESNFTYDDMDTLPIQNNTVYTSGSIVALQSFATNNRVELVEGLVVDTISGGVGFRNHTIPADIGLGVEWQEEILWIEPVTECVDLNLTIEFNKLLWYAPSIRREESFLVDHGGMSNLPDEEPLFDLTDAQSDPKLSETSYKVAVWTNLYTAAYFNLTSDRVPGVAHLGAKYSLAHPNGLYRGYVPAHNEIKIAPVNGDFLPLPYHRMNETWSDITSSNFTWVDLISRRYGGADVVDMSVVGIANGLLMGAPHLADGSDSLVLDQETDWVQNMMACSSAARASVKIIKFLANGTALQDIQVLDVADKTYRNEADMPLWAIERTNHTINLYSPLWGIVDDRYEDSDALYTRRKEKLWLPAGETFYQKRLTYLSDSMPSGAHLKALSAAYDVTSDSLHEGFMRYTGYNDHGLAVKWRELSRDAKTAGKIINIIWTDIMANMLIGTKPGPYSSDTSLGSDAGYNRLVQTMERRVNYDIKYGIPAFFMLLIWICILTTASFLFLTSRVSFSALKQLSNQLAPGRIATNLYGVSNGARADAPTNEWAAKAGAVVFAFQRFGNSFSRSSGAEDTSAAESTSDLRLIPLRDSDTHGRSDPVARVINGRGPVGSVSVPREKTLPETRALMHDEALPATRFLVS
ncbi:hypothetical protein BJY04DRAFT_215865 [Aspergillus karnatakaensis]|uniref:uncharacterized protein n=1 Tax=Aspergillus karnatakaensis TaxID=1810916 RepID=UPI003CCD39D2